MNPDSRVVIVITRLRAGLNLENEPEAAVATSIVYVGAPDTGFEDAYAGFYRHRAQYVAEGHALTVELVSKRLGLP